VEHATDNPATLPPTPTATTDLPLKTGTWTLDPAHARVGFAVRHLGLAKVRGSFTDVDAELVVGDSLEHTAVNASIATASIDTAQPVRDANLRSPAMLDVEQRPTITFRSTAIRGGGADWTLDGELTIGAVTRSVSLDATLHGVAEVYGGARHAGFEARGTLRREDVGLSFGPLDPVVGQVVDIELDLELVEPT
jgi:polyisoprenoid-binding protein YceI